MKSLLKILSRKLKARPVFSFVTIFGFTVGIASSLLIYLWVYNELSYEKFHQDYQRVYRVLTLAKQGDEIVKSASSYSPLASTLKNDYPQVETATYISFNSEDSPLQISDDSEKMDGRGCWLNDHFFNVFEGFTFKEGSSETALSNPSGIILNADMAYKLFGDKPALGKSIIINKYFREEFTVSAVIEFPSQSHIRFDYAISEKNSQVAAFTRSWSKSSYVHVYFKLKKGAETDGEFLTRITDHLSRYTSFTDKLMFQPIADIHLYSDYNTSLDKNIGSYIYVWIFSGLALLIVLMASLNFSILSVARASERLTEIGVKKVNGASRFQIASQFLNESLLQTFFSMVLAILLVWLTLPLFNHLSGQQLHLHLSLKLLFNLMILTLFVGLAAGIYPAWYLSSLTPAGIIKDKSPVGSGARMIRLLPFVQFVIAIFFVVTTTVFIKQMNYIRNKDLGFNDKNIVVVPTGLWYDNRAFKDELLKNPNILSVSSSVYAPVDFGWKTNIPFSRGNGSDSLQASMFWADEDFAATYNIEVVKGRFLQMNYNDYWKELKGKGKMDDKTRISLPVVINETAKKKLGFENPIGQRLGDFVIVGVVKDFHYRPLRYPIEPLILTNDPQNIMSANIRISPENKMATLKYIGDTYRKYRDNRTFSYQFFDDLLNDKYSSEIHLRNLTFLFATLAIIIAILGILGMSVFSTVKRTKEIGIRKVNGATLVEVLVLLNKDFMKWVVISFLVATPAAWYAANRWLGNFAYKTSLSWWIFALAGVLALGIAIFTVSFQSWKAATRNPVESLRYE
ncbi:MAG TPA: ABC transporter permease [Draconibacterium sp.]|nr:ABC transporter permease [Draconibacterium sp.]